MFAILTIKELRQIITSLKFVATFSTCSILILLSVWIGIQEYKTNKSQVELGNNLAAQSLSERTGWMGISTNIFREPDPMQIFISGVNYDVGRLSAISQNAQVKLQDSSYTNDLIFAVFRVIDFAFIVMVVLTLFAILFTYDAINGERELGTLKLIFSNPISRSTFLLAKFSGAWLGLVIPLLVPIIISVIMVELSGVPLTGEHYSKLGMMILLSLLLFTFFIFMGLFVSVLTQKSSTSFLILLVAWVLLVLIAPRLGVMLAGELIPVPALVEVESKMDRFRKDQWDSYSKLMGEKWQKRNAEVEQLPVSQRSDYRETKEWDWLQQDESEREIITQSISDYASKMMEDIRNRQTMQQDLAFSLARFSPPAGYQLSMMNLAGTDVEIKKRYEELLESYKKDFFGYITAKQKENGGARSGGFSISMGSDGFKINTGASQGVINLSDIPKFQYKPMSMNKLLPHIFIDICIISIFSLLTFWGAFQLFLQYDVR